MNNIQVYLLESAIHAMHERVGGLIANDGLALFSKQLNPVLIAESLEELTNLIKTAAEKHESSIATDCEYLRGIFRSNFMAGARTN